MDAAAGLDDDDDDDDGEHEVTEVLATGSAEEQVVAVGEQAN